MSHHHPSPLFYSVLVAIVIAAVLLVAIVTILSWSRTRPPHDEIPESVRMTRRQRRALLTERYDLNPALRRRS